MSDVPPPPQPEPTDPTSGPVSDPASGPAQPPAGPTISLPSADQVTGALKAARPLDLVAAGLALSTFLWSFLPYYTVSVKMAGFSESDSITAWHGFFGWAATFLAFGAGVLLVLQLLASVLTVEALAAIPLRLVAAGALGVALLFVLIAFFVTPGGGCDGLSMCEDAVDFGRGVGWYLSFLAIAGATAITGLGLRGAKA